LSRMPDAGTDAEPSLHNEVTSSVRSRSWSSLREDVEGVWVLGSAVLRRRWFWEAVGIVTAVASTGYGLKSATEHIADEYADALARRLGGSEFLRRSSLYFLCFVAGLGLLVSVGSLARGRSSHQTAGNMSPWKTPLSPHIQSLGGRRAVSIGNAGVMPLLCRVFPAVNLYGWLVILFVTRIWSIPCFSWCMAALCIQMWWWLFKTSFFSIVGIVTVRKWLRRDWVRPYRKLLEQGKKPICHIVILPNYKEALEVLADTMAGLAASEIARECMVVVLAMEAREGKDAQEKAAVLKREFQGKFLEILETYHPSHVRGEVVGKSSNTQWAFRCVQSDWVNRQVEVKAWQKSQMVITISDADSIFHPDYFSALSIDAMELPEERLRWRLWQAPIWLLRNYFTVPAPTRLTGYTTSVAELGGLRSWFGCHITFSSYSVHYLLAEEVGGWDVDVIAEDHHMFCKCFFGSVYASAATEEYDQLDASQCFAQIELQRIFLPVKGYMVEAGDWWTSVVARFTQARRHTQGISEFAYVLLHYANLIRRAGSIIQIPLSTHEKIFQILYTMLGAHTFPYLHLTAMVLAATWGEWNEPTDCFTHSECGDWMTQLSCLIMVLNVYLFSIPVALNIVATLLVVLEGCGLSPNRQADNDDGHLWEKLTGGAPSLTLMRKVWFLFLQIALETAVMAAPALIGLGMVPELMACVSLARRGNAFKYVVAEKPSTHKQD